MSKAAKLYRQFTQKEPDAIEQIRVDWPDQVGLVGIATRSEYLSDKWNDDGDVIHYYHDHDSRPPPSLYLPAGSQDWLAETGIQGDWPREVWMLGFAMMAEAQRHDGAGAFRISWPWTEHLPVGRVGWREAQDRDLPVWIGWPNGHVLAVLHPSEGILAVVAGRKLRVTERGIEG